MTSWPVPGTPLFVEGIVRGENGRLSAWATLENGLVVKVPQHLNVGDLVKIDTRDGSTGGSGGSGGYYLGPGATEADVLALVPVLEGQVGTHVREVLGVTRLVQQHAVVVLPSLGEHHEVDLVGNPHRRAEGTR